MKARGVDVVDCSSGGNSPKGATNSSFKRGPGFQAPYAKKVRAEAGIMTQAVGLIREARFAESLLQDGSADLIALARQILFDPFWPHHAARDLGVDMDYEAWPKQYGWWLEKWDKSLQATAERP
jgi:2,4-dienoyl-CoA reductase-like NADH-dependent reductase (Old Yellow Enzyme family)